MTRLIILHDRLVKPDEADFLGRILVRRLPAMTHAEYMEWWPCLSEQERARYTVDETRNLITTLGRTQVLTFIGSTSTTSPFSQYFAVGIFPTLTVSPGDTVINTEIYRAVPSTWTISGNTVDISTFFGTSQANGTLTNCGLFGGNATSSPGTGTLMTHAILNTYVKDNSHTVSFDYLITLS